MPQANGMGELPSHTSGGRVHQSVFLAALRIVPGKEMEQDSAWHAGMETAAL